MIRLSAIGDVVMSGIVAKALKQRWPDCRLTWLAEPAAAELLRANPHVDEVMVWDKESWKAQYRSWSVVTLIGSLLSLRRQLRRQAFDWVLDLQGLFKSGVLAALTGAPRRIGLGSKEGSGIFMTRTINRATQSRLIGSEYWELCKTLGTPLSSKDFRIPLYTEQDTAAVTRLLAERKVGDRYVVICPFTTRPQKHWISQRWARLADALIDRYGVDVVMLGAPADRPEADKIDADSRSIDSLVGQTSLRQCAAIISRASLVIGVDTGLTHIAMLGEPTTFALFGSTLPYQLPEKPTDKIFFKHLHCAPCRRHPTCNGRYDCMREIGVEELLTHAASVLG